MSVKRLCQNSISNILILIAICHPGVMFQPYDNYSIKEVHAFKSILAYFPLFNPLNPIIKEKENVI